MKNILLLITLFFYQPNGQAQLIETYDLPIALVEASGLEKLNDSVFISINDGGNKPIIFLISSSGKLLKKNPVIGSKNKDWENRRPKQASPSIPNF